ncbi:MULTISPECIES: F390 synthetase-related protein [unclassified Polaribacter]|uniref:F390 synthetase-related protein n=1 Tax=unclassified Polaribacter TaxID=196858 RepID=UPI00052CE219|nr:MULTISPECIES: F390 synthetase-related protein [unclassified Polaribacter]KGL61266.1 coenzyme F390 synthetase [Polaribacter sp. Hel1_33_49]PKV64459.1 putative adenylate-forming enzyme [Polaribacter sp. Hel1_33_96]
MYFKIQILIALFKLKVYKWLYKNRLDKLQSIRWKKLQHILLTSPFYKENALKNKPLQEYPLINKSEFMLNFDQINTMSITISEAMEVAEKAEQLRDFSPTIKDITIGLSSGTSGNRGVFMASQKERANWVACVLDRVIGFSLKKRRVAFFLRANSNLYSSITSKILSFEFFDILGQLDSYVEKLNSLKPTILVAQPSILVELASYMEKGVLSISPSKIISVAEVLSPEDSKYLKNIFKQTIHQVYQCTEGLLATTCSHGNLHFNDDFLILEKKYLDAEKKRFHPVITDLLRTTQPVIRYELNDIIHEKNNCPCGSKKTVIEKIEGRSDDVLSFKSNQNEKVIIYPDFFRREIILAHPSINDFTIVQKTDSHLELYLKQSEHYSLAEKRLKNFLKSQGVYDIIIEQVALKHHTKGNKLRRVKNEKKEN